MDDSFDNWLKERASETDADDGRLSPGTVIGAYRVETFLGKGGFAEVYSAKASNGALLMILTGHGLLLLGIVVGGLAAFFLLRMFICGGGGSW